MTLSGELRKTGNDRNISATGSLATVPTEGIFMPHPLDPIRQVIEEKSLELSDLAEKMGCSVETIEKLLNKGFDGALCDQTLDPIERLPATNTLNNLVIVVNNLAGSKFEAAEILQNYYEMECV